MVIPVPSAPVDMTSKPNEQRAHIRRPIPFWLMWAWLALPSASSFFRGAQPTKTKEKRIGMPSPASSTSLRLGADWARANPFWSTLGILSVCVVPVLDLLALPACYRAAMQRCGRPGGGMGAVSLALGGTLLGVALLHALREWVLEHVVPGLERHIKLAIVEHLLRDPAQHCQPRSSGDVIFLMVRVSASVQKCLYLVTELFLPYGVTVLVTLIAMARYDRWLSLTWLGLAAAVAGLLHVAAPAARCSAAADESARRMARLHGRLDEVVRLGHTVQASGSLARELRDLRDRDFPVAFQPHHILSRCMRRQQALFVPALVLFVVVFLWRSDRLVRGGRVSHDAFVAALLLVMGMVPAVLWLAESWSTMGGELGHIRTMDELLLPRSSQDGGCGTPPPGGAGAMQPPPPPATASFVGLWDVSFGYGGDPERRRPLLFDRLTLGFRSGEWTALVGPVGSGKTTVLRLLLGFCAPRAGQCYVDGRWYADLGPDGVRARVGCVPQDPVLFAGTVLYNVRYGHEEHVDEATAAAYVREYGGHPLAERLGEDVGPGGGRLSGGQRQIVWCLRLLLRPPPVVLLDEPTSSLDADSRALLLRLLERRLLGTATTVIIVSHDPELLRHAHRRHSLR